MLQFATYYHIYNHANGDDNLFREAKNYDFFLKKYHQHIDPIADTVAWCLMPNHFHLLVKIKKEEDIASVFPKFRTLEKLEDRSKFLSKRFSNFFSSYTQAFNKVYKRRDSLFIKNFKRKEILDDDYLQNIVLYIHLNPVKHGFTKRIEDWKHHSYTDLPKLNDKLLKALFGGYANYKSAHQAGEAGFGGYDYLEEDLTR